MNLRAVLPVVLFAALSTRTAWAIAPPSPFQDKPEPVRGVHVDALEQWNGTAPVLLHAPDDNDRDERLRLGTVLIAPGVSVNVDTVDNQVNFPYFFELGLAKAKSGAGGVLLKLPVMDLGATEWYFPGNGFVYVDTKQWGLCGPHTTRKFVLSGHVLVEVPQPLVYIGAMSQVVKTTPLFDAPDGRKVVATVAAGTQVLVVGMQYQPQPERAGALLVRTPLGLSGWHRPYAGQVPDDGEIDLYLCN